MSQYMRYCFLGEYFDSMASIVRQYQVFIYPEDQSIEIYDLRTRKIFLKRIVCPDVKLKDFFVGADVNIYSRRIKISDYGDEFTAKAFQNLRNSAFVMLLPSAYMQIGKIIDSICQNGFSITQMKMNKLSQKDASEFIKIHKGDGLTTDLLCADYVVGIEVTKKNAVEEFPSLIQKEIIPKYQTEGKPIIVSSPSLEVAQAELNYFFPIKANPQLTNCSCFIIKPHVILDGNAGKVIDILLNEGFEISSMRMFYLDKITAEDFFDVYKGVLPEYAAIINHISSGPIIALEIRQDDVVNKLRALIGPHDPEIAKVLRPNTLRATFGVDRVRNVCHCTDLPEDGILECQYLFELL
ncbi:MAG: hypothetical protein MJ252_16885 [archaeon]|nr:hypothetical protein [archaeon]